VESLHAQQVTIHEKKAMKSNLKPGKQYCPRTDTIKQSNEKIKELQQNNHTIVLMLYANQMVLECFTGSQLKPHSIEWLWTQRGMEDLLIQMTGSRPHYTAQMPNRCIDFIYTYGEDEPFCTFRLLLILI